MLEKSMSIETDSKKIFFANKTLKTSNNKEPCMTKIKKNEPIHYYYTDPLNYQWCFTETRGSSQDYYYKCSTSKCSGFGMTNKYKKDASFILTKSHSIPY